ncbi:MAG: four helix bundle protein [Saprospiraceae bacterium]|nr:four helix bundle protein [Saprospiraceae bacterium]
MNIIKTYKDLDVYNLSLSIAMRIFHLAKKFPQEERYSLIDQITRSSRSVCANISEAFRARLYEKSFVSKLVIAQCEAAETQTWLDFALECKYIENNDYNSIFKEYDHIIAMLVNMIQNADKWTI